MWDVGVEETLAMRKEGDWQKIVVSIHAALCPKCAYWEQG
jgi:hypothetical protein